MSGSAVLAMLPSVSQKPLGPTWAPAGNEAHLAELRSTAGSCFGRFIGLLLCVEFTGIGTQRAKDECLSRRAGGRLLCKLPTPIDHSASRRLWPTGIRLSQLKEGPTLAPAGTEVHLLDLRSTAGSCFGRFMSCTSITIGPTLPGRQVADEAPTSGRQTCRHQAVRLLVAR